MLRIEHGLTLLSLLIAFIYPSLGARWFERVEYQFARLSRHRTLAVTFVAFVALGSRIALLPIEYRLGLAAGPHSALPRTSSTRLTWRLTECCC
jgi:hypothetical protein